MVIAPVSTMKGLIGACASFVVAACGSGVSNPAVSRDTLPPPVVYSNDNSRELTAPERKLVSAYVAKQMREPESARFEWTRVDKTPNGVVHYCALVNGRNAYGGFTGMVPYIATFQVSNGKITEVRDVMLGGSGPATSDVRTECRRRNVPDPAA